MALLVKYGINLPIQTYLGRQAQIILLSKIQFLLTFFRTVPLTFKFGNKTVILVSSKFDVVEAKLNQTFLLKTLKYSLTTSGSKVSEIFHTNLRVSTVPLM